MADSLPDKPGYEDYLKFTYHESIFMQNWKVSKSEISTVTISVCYEYMDCLLHMVN